MWVFKDIIFFIIFSFLMQAWNVFGQHPNLRSRRSPEEPSPRIIGGRPALAAEVPWNLQLIYKGDFLCSAALVQSKATPYHFALTSADCLKPQDGKPIDEKRLEVVAGVVDRTVGIEPQQERERVREVIRHPTYVYQDVAFLLLDRQFSKKETIIPIALPPRPDFYPDLNVRLTVAGWGSSKKGDNTHRSNHLQVKTYQGCALPDCQYAFPSGHVLDTALCAWDEPTDGHDGVCHGDWGAAAISADAGTPYIAGIFSWIVGKCGETRKPSIFVRVSSVVKWILEVDEKYKDEYNKNP